MGDIGEPLRRVEFDPMYVPAPEEPAVVPAPVVVPAEPVAVPA